MASTPLKERKNSSKLWQHATKVFHDNGTIRYIKCNHCAKTSKHQTNASRHLKTVHFNHVAPSQNEESPHRCPPPTLSNTASTRHE